MAQDEQAARKRLEKENDELRGQASTLRAQYAALLTKNEVWTD